ncbi:MAG TPA: hypothetical protein VGC52_00660, partial [Gemmatimonadaceae bacterium]
AIIANLGKVSSTIASRDFRAVQIPEATDNVQAVEVASRRVTGVDVFIESSLQPDELGADLVEICSGTTVNLQMIGNRGNTVWPVDDGRKVTLVDQYRCRFMKKARNEPLSNSEILALLTRIGETHTWMHVEKLQQFDGDDAFSRTQK